MLSQFWKKLRLSTLLETLGAIRCLDHSRSLSRSSGYSFGLTRAQSVFLASPYVSAARRQTSSLRPTFPTLSFSLADSCFGGRTLFYWNVVPIAISFLLPKRLSSFIWYVGPSNSAMNFDLVDGVVSY